MVGLLDGGGGLLPFGDEGFGQFPARWNPVGQMMTPADPTMQAGLLALAQRLRTPTTVPPENGAQPPTNAMAAGILPSGPPMQPGAPPMQPGAQNAQPPATPNSGGGFWNGLGNAISANPLTLMALGGGIMRGGLGAGLQQATPVAAQERQFNLQQQALAGTYEALKKAGVPDAVARAAALNPKLLSTIAPEFFGGYKVVQVGEDPLGKKFVLQGPGGKFFPIGGGTGEPGSVVGAGETTGQSGGLPGSGGGGVGMPSMRLLAPGVDQFNPTLQGEDYLAQFAPEVQAAVKAYMRGDVMPTGNPRQQGIASIAKTIAQKYGQDIGIPANDTEYTRKRKLQLDLGSSSPNSMGGILSNGKSAFGHLANLSDKYVALNNYNGPDIPGGAIIANTGNAITNTLGTSETAGKIGAANENALRYGQEATKFYAGTGGGEAERMAAAKNNPARSGSGNEQAAFLETEKELMLERMRQKESQIRQDLGQDWLDRNPVSTKDMQDHIRKIDANIAKLRNRGASAPATQPQQPQSTLSRPATPDEARKLPKGTHFVDPSGVERVR